MSSIGYELTFIPDECFPPFPRLPSCPCSQRSRYWLVYVLNFICTFYLMILVVYKWTVLGTISKEFKEPSNRWGLVTLTIADIIFVFSRPIVRAKAYNLFRTTHFVGYILIIPAVSEFIHVLYLLNSYGTRCTRTIQLLSHSLSLFQFSTFWIAHFACSRHASLMPQSVPCRPFLRRVLRSPHSIMVGELANMLGYASCPHHSVGSAGESPIHSPLRALQPTQTPVSPERKGLF